MTEYWWRSWHGAPMDHKWSVIAARSGVKVGIVSAIAWALLDYASQHKERGTVEGFDVETYSVYSGFSEDEINAVIQAMTDKEVIRDGKFSNWDKRQPKSEKEIQRATENRKKKQEREQRYEMLQNVTEKYIDTESDKDTDKDKEKKEEGATTPASLDLEADLFMRVTGMLTIPGKKQETENARDVLRVIRSQHPGNEAVFYLQPYYKAWRERRYSPSNTAWLTEWAVSGEIPQPKNGAGTETLADAFLNYGRSANGK